MERSHTNLTVGRNVADAMRTRNVSTTTLADAADIDEQSLRANLRGYSDFTAADLVAVGGVLGFRPSMFLAGAA